MYNDIKYLNWDSNFFSLKIGQMFVNNDDNLIDRLEDALKSKYDLIYLIGDNEFIINNEILLKYNGKLVDRKVTYIKYLKLIKEEMPFIYEYLKNELKPELEQLAYEAGKYSRFKLDNNFKEIYFYKMYKTWIEESIKHNIANKIFVADNKNIIKGFVTLKILDNKGVIGLIAVSPNSQGKGYGKSLLNICENTLFNNNVKQIEVSTQFENYNACSFYEKCGYKINEIKNIYHFWLKENNDHNQ